jgi:hypothetical protein
LSARDFASAAHAVVRFVFAERFEDIVEVVLEGKVFRICWFNYLIYQ